MFTKTNHGYINLNMVEMVVVEEINRQGEYGIFLYIPDSVDESCVGYLMNDKVYDTREEAEKTLEEVMGGINLLSKLSLPL